jgi:hypothetical protein
MLRQEDRVLRPNESNEYRPTPLRLKEGTVPCWGRAAPAPSGCRGAREAPAKQPAGGRRTSGDRTVPGQVTVRPPVASCKRIKTYFLPEIPFTKEKVGLPVRTTCCVLPLLQSIVTVPDPVLPFWLIVDPNWPFVIAMLPELTMMLELTTSSVGPQEDV